MSPPIKNRPAAQPKPLHPTAKPAAKPDAKAPTAETKPAPAPWQKKGEGPRTRQQDEFFAALEKMPQPELPSARKTQVMQAAKKLLASPVSEANAKEALAQLSTLEPRDFKEAMEELKTGGQLEAMLTTLPREGRSQFVTIASGKGYVRAASQAPKPNAPFDPPQNPRVFITEPHLPRCVNDAIAAKNLSSYAQYKKDYAGYVDRYAAAAGAAKSLPELTKLGHPVWPFHDPLASSGKVEGDGAHKEALKNLGWASQTDAYRAVGEAVYRLTNQPTDGKFWMSKHVELVSNGVAAEYSTRTDRPDGESSIGAQVGNGHARGRVMVDQDGKVITSVKGEVGSAEAEAKFKDGKLDEVAVKNTFANGIGVEQALDREGTSTTTVTVEADLGKGKVAGGGAVAVNPNTGQGSVAVVNEVKLGDREIKVKIGFGYTGISIQHAKDAVRGESVLDRK